MFLQEMTCFNLIYPSQIIDVKFIYTFLLELNLHGKFLKKIINKIILRKGFEFGKKVGSYLPL